MCQLVIHLYCAMCVCGYGVSCNKQSVNITSITLRACEKENNYPYRYNQELIIEERSVQPCIELLQIIVLSQRASSRHDNVPTKLIW